MRFIVIVSFFLAVALAASPARAQVVGGGKKGEFAEHQPFAQTPDEAFKEARERQCPVVLCVCDQGITGEWAEPGEFCKDGVKRVAKYFVILVSHPAYSVVFGWAGQYARRAGERDDDTNIYEFFDCNGCHMSKYGLRQGASADHLIATMKKVVKDKGRGMSFSEYRKHKPQFEYANKVLDVGWYDEAYSVYEKLSKTKFKPEPPMVATSKQKLEEIVNTVKEKLEECKEKIKQGAKAEALVDLQILRSRARTMKIAVEIAKEIVALEKEPSITADEKKKAGDEGKACEIFLRAEGYAAEDNKKSAKMYFERVINIYKESSFREKAEQRIEELDI